MSKRRTEPEVIVFEEPKFKKRKITTREKDICRVSHHASLAKPHVTHILYYMPRGCVLFVQSADVTHLFSHKPETNTSASGKSKKTEELDFKATLLEVQKYGIKYNIWHMVCDSTHVCMYCMCCTAVSSLTGKNKRRREEEQIIALGGKVGAKKSPASLSSFTHFKLRFMFFWHHLGAVTASQVREDAIPTLSEENEDKNKERTPRTTRGK